MELFSGYGCTVIERNERFYIQYDSGESSGASLVENEITAEEIEKAKKSEQDAYEVILAAEHRGSPRKVGI
jgi:hypothetical protein